MAVLFCFLKTEKMIASVGVSAGECVLRAKSV